MGQRISLEDYLQQFYPRILEQYRDYSKTYKGLTPESICKKDIDFSKISHVAADNMRKQGIIQVGNLIRVLMLYKNLDWVPGVGKATWERLYNQLAPYGVDIKHLDKTDPNIKGFAYRHYRRHIPDTIRDVLGDKAANEFAEQHMYSMDNLIWQYANDRYWIMSQPLSVRSAIAKYAPQMKDLKEEFKREE